MWRPRSAVNDNNPPKRPGPVGDRIERALITLEYALADARALESARAFARLERLAREQSERAKAGRDVLLSLQTAALHRAARRAAQWD